MTSPVRHRSWSHNCGNAAQDAVAEMRGSGQVRARFNIAAAEVNIDGQDSYLLRSASGETVRPGTVPEVGTASNPLRFIPGATGNNSSRFRISELTWRLGMVDPSEMTPAHRAVEFEDLPALRDLLDAGGDINEEHYGLTLLHHAIDVEVDNHDQSGEPLHVDTTAYLLARGADCSRKSSDERGVSAEHMALVGGHWLASALFAAWNGR